MTGQASVWRSADAAPADRRAAFALLVAAPMLFPLTSGPLAAAWQALFTGACALVLGWWGGAGAPERSPWRVASAVLAVLVLTAAWTSSAATGPLGAVVVVCAGGLAAAGRGRGDTGSALAIGLLGAGAASAVIGLFQYFGAGAGLSPWAVDPIEPLGMAYGNLRQRNQFASLLAMSLVALIWLLAAHPGRRTIPRGVAIGVAALLVVGLAASTSRTGLLELLLIVAAAAWLGWRERRTALGSGHRRRHLHPALWLGALPLYAIACWLLPWLAADHVEGMLLRLRDGAPPGHGRLVLWGNVLELIAQHPWRGWGWGELSYAHYMHPYAGERFVEILDNAHNLPLHLAAELGVPAAVAVCGAFVWMVVRARPWAERDPARLMAWGLLGVIVLHSLLEYPLWYGPFQLVFGLCLGLLWPGRAATNARSKGPLAPVLSAVVATALIAIAGAAAWDYTRVSQIYLPREERLAGWRDDTLARLHDRSWFFARQVKFAELTLTPVTRENAAAMYELAGEMLHFSPEPRVVSKRIQAAALLGKDDEVAAQLLRFRTAYPEEYIRWLGALPPR